MTYDEITYPETAILVISIIIAVVLVWTAVLLWERVRTFRLPRIFKRKPTRAALIAELSAERERNWLLTQENKVLMQENRRLRGMGR